MALLPLQMVADGLAVIVAVGMGLTVTVTVFVPTHPAVVPVTVYVVVIVGFATGSEMFVLLKPVEGDQA